MPYRMNMVLAHFLISWIIIYAVERILEIIQVAGSSDNCYVSKQVYGHVSTVPSYAEHVRGSAFHLAIL